MWNPVTKLQNYLCFNNSKIVCGSVTSSEVVHVLLVVCGGDKRTGTWLGRRRGCGRGRGRRGLTAAEDGRRRHAARLLAGQPGTELIFMFSFLAHTIFPPVLGCQLRYIHKHSHI